MQLAPFDYNKNRNYLNIRYGKGKGIYVQSLNMIKRIGDGASIS